MSGPKRGEVAWSWPGGFDEVVGGELAEVGEAGGVEGVLGEGSVFLLGFGEGGVAEAAGVEGGAALTDSFGDEVRERGEAIWELTEKEPADSPKRVMLLGSPPKLEMLRLTQAMAAAWSRRP